ncbi:MAG TPA: glycosyltransferase [Gemmatimonadales bacterium]|nr:glycosyltransferase [Gemmatimonadales bacterium]
MSDPPPTLSIIVTIVSGGEALRRCLDAIGAQRDAPPLEILVPFDASAGLSADVRRAYPSIRFLELGVLPTRRPPGSPAGQHELYDRRRAAGLAAARGELVAILEDRGAPRSDWASTMVRLHRGHPHAVIGGAVESVSPDSLNRAFHLCDFERYSLPFESGPRTSISDVNVCYTRQAVETTRAVWTVRFHESRVHAALREVGTTLFLSSEAVVDHRTSYDSLWRLLPERAAWGRLFGALRAAELSWGRRVGYVLAGPVLPFVLLVRHGRAQWRKRRLASFLRLVPLMLPLLLAWTVGEVWGTLTGR